MATQLLQIRLTRPGLHGVYICNAKLELDDDGHIISGAAQNAQGNASFTRLPDGRWQDDADGGRIYTSVDD